MATHIVGQRALGNVFIREMALKAGETVEGHAHNFDHVTYVPKGTVLVHKLDAEGNTLRSVRKEAGDYLLIVAGVCHRIIAITDALVHCIYAHRTAQGDVVQEYTGWQEGNI